MITNTFVPSNLTDSRQRPAAAIHLVQTSRFARRLARWLVVLMVLSILGMAILPWQQTSRGTGEVVAFIPQERQQTIESPVEGVVVAVTSGLVDGSVVKQGDVILELQPVVADLEQQLEAQLRDLQIKLQTAVAKAEAHGQNVIGYTEARDFAVSAAEQLVEAAREKLESKQSLLSGYESELWQAEQNLQRQEKLQQLGIKAAREVEILQKERDVAQSRLDSLNEEIASLDREWAAQQDLLEENRNVAQTKIDYARAMQQDALGNAASIRKDIKDLEIKQAPLERQTITAPRDGTIFRLPVYERGQMVRKGEALLTLVPEVTQTAVQLMVPGNDMPLIQPGQEVRLQFEGWPAVQFPGWPSVAVGTFSGEVALVDPTDNGAGQFRILVVPRPGEPAWPSNRFLRQGVRANGWVMLNQVALGYEVWRQLNGFPVLMKDPASTKTDAKPVLPK